MNQAAIKNLLLSVHEYMTMLINNFSEETMQSIINRTLVFLFCFIIVGCGTKSSRKEPEKTETKKAEQRLTDEQKGIFFNTLVAEMRFNSAVSSVEEATAPLTLASKRMLMNQIVNVLQNRLTMLEEQEDPTLTKMKELLNATCKNKTEKIENGNTLELKSQFIDFNNAVCPAAFSVNAKAQGDKGSASFTVNTDYHAVDSNFASLNDIDKASSNGDGTISVVENQAENSIKISGNATFRGVEHSKSQGNLAYALALNGELNAVKNGDQLTGSFNGQVIHSIDFADFAAELKIVTRSEGDKIIVEMWINGEKIEPQTTKQYLN